MEEIERLGFCELVVLRHESRGDRPRGLRHALYSAYERLDRRVFGSDDDPLAAVPVRRPAVPLAEIAAQHLDVVVCLAPGASPDDLARHARLGAWYLHVPKLVWQMQ